MSQNLVSLQDNEKFHCYNRKFNKGISHSVVRTTTKSTKCELKINSNKTNTKI